MSRLDGKVAVVTGASQNVGLEVARLFAASGATVVMAARRREQLEARADQVRRETDATVRTVVSDVSEGEGTAALAAAVLDEFGSADILVNNAYASGNTFGMHVLDIPDSAWDLTYRANVLGPFRLIRSFGKAMLGAGGGSIINVLSGSGFQPTPEVTPYGAMKSALWMMTRYLSIELAPLIRVNGLVPGLTMSDTGGPPSGPITERLAALVPMGRAGHPREVAHAALYLASDEAAYTTGTVLFVNGGRLW